MIYYAGERDAFGRLCRQRRRSRLQRAGGRSRRTVFGHPVAEYRRAEAAEAAARARQDVATRGLVATVVQNYYGLATAQRHLANAARGVDEAQAFADITRKQEAGGEAAHADVIKAELQVQQRPPRPDGCGGETRVRRGSRCRGDAARHQPALSHRRRFGSGCALALARRIPGAGAERQSRSPRAEAGLRQAGFAIRSARACTILRWLWTISGHRRQRIRHTAANDRKTWASAVRLRQRPGLELGREREQSAAGGDSAQAGRDRTDLVSDSFWPHCGVPPGSTGGRTPNSIRSHFAGPRDGKPAADRPAVQSGEATALEVADAQSTLAQSRNAYDDGLARYRVALANMQTLTGKL